VVAEAVVAEAEEAAVVVEVAEAAEAVAEVVARPRS
jgi:hypothetical protein